MFDWNDEELTNIIWGEAGESGDHIVPYTNQIEDKPRAIFGELRKKETNPHSSDISPAEQKEPTLKSQQGDEFDNIYEYDVGEPESGFCLDSWYVPQDPSSSNVARSDHGSLCTDASTDQPNGSKNYSIGENTSKLDIDSEMFEEPLENGEQSDFVDYGWASIGSFDDLDRIFSNNDPMFGDLGVGNADELWSSSKDTTSCPLELTPLSGSSSEIQLGALKTSTNQSEIKDHHVLDLCKSFISGYGKLKEIKSQAPQDVQASIDIFEHYGGKSSLLGKEKPKTSATGGKIQASRKLLNHGAPATLNETADRANKRKRIIKGQKLDISCVQANKRKRIIKGQKLDKKSEVSSLHDSTVMWTSSGVPLQQVNSQHASLMVNPSPLLPLTQQRSLLQMPQHFQLQNCSGAPLVSPFYGNMLHHHPAPSVLASCGYEAHPANRNSSKNSEDASAKPPPMTPKEKIEKLRRRQQMRAILAIQKQQQQFGNQVSVSENSSLEGGKVGVNNAVGSFPSLEPKSPMEQDDSSTISMAFDNRSVEESVLHRLQYTISKLDMRIRLCIRDSLLRLTQSATQRQLPNDTSITRTSSKDEARGNEDIIGDQRFMRVPDVETETNPIDRTVAQLLFHRPPDFSGKPTDTPELRINEKGSLPESVDNMLMESPRGLKSSSTFSEGNLSKNSLSYEIMMRDKRKLKPPNEEDKVCQ